MDTTTIQVNFPDSSIRDIEIAVYENTLITLYNNRIYQSDEIKCNYVNKCKNNLHSYSTFQTYNNKLDMFILVYKLDATSSRMFALCRELDRNDEIGSFIRANELFGTSSNEYIIK